MRWFYRILSAIAVVLVLGFLTLALMPKDRIAALATSEFARLTGRQLQIEGGVSASFWPVIGVETGPVSIANADWSDQGPLLRADSMAIGVDPVALWNGSLRITRLDLIRPDLVLERAADGTGNWAVAPSAAPADAAPVVAAKEGSQAMPVILEGATFRDGRIRWIDHGSDRVVELTDVSGEARFPGLAEPADLSLSATLGAQEVRAEMRLAGLAPLLTGQSVPLTLTASAGEASLSFDGGATLGPLALSGALKADLADLAAVSALAGLPSPALPEGWGARSVQVSARVALDAAATLRLDGATITLDDRQITGDLVLAQGEARPRLTGRIRTGALALGAAPAAPAGAALSGGTAPASAPAAQGWSNASIDASGLGILDADLAFVTDALTLGPLRLGAVDGTLTLDRSRAVLTLPRVAAYGGVLSGTMVANNRGGLSVAAKLGLSGVDLQPLLTDVAGITRLSGPGNLSVDLLGAGPSVAAIMDSLRGTVQVSLGPGAISGIDIGTILATLDPTRVSGGESLFDSLIASFTVDGGQMRGDDLSILGPVFTATGSGRIGLGARDIDYRLRPVAQSGGEGVAVPVMVRGPWSAPRITLDLEAMARERFDAQLKAAEAEARTRAIELREDLKARAAEELGVVPGADLEEAARQRLEEELQKQTEDALRELLGGN